MSRNYAPSTIDVVGDLVNGLHVETGVFDTADWWNGSGGSEDQCELFNVYGRILLLQLYVEMVTASGGGATLIQFNATFSIPSETVQPISAASATTAALLAGGRVVWLGGDITSIPVVTVLVGGGISDVIAVNRQIIGSVGGVGTIGTLASVADNVSGTARGNLFYAPLSDNAYVTAYR